MRSMGTWFCFAAMLSLLLSAGCSGSAGDTTEVASPVSGLLREIEASPSGEIVSITLEIEGGEVIEFAVELVPAGAVGAEHLQLHIDQELSVSVSFAGEADRRVAYQIDDAPP